MATKIKIKRKRTGTKTQPQQIRDNAKVKLSSVFVSGRPIQGLNSEEIKMIMPRIIDADPQDPKFYEKVSTWFNELSVDIPATGRELDIGLRDKVKVTDVNGKEVEVPIPRTPREYCIYRFAQVHPLVAANEKEAKTYRNKRFWIENPDDVKRKSTNERRVKTQAYAKLMEIEESEDQVDHMLRVFGNVKPESFGTLDEKINTLTEKMENDPEQFIEVAEDKNLKMQDFILQCIEHGVLRRVGNSIMYMQEEIGVGLEEAVVYLQSKRNSGTESELRAKLKEAKG